MKLLWSPNDVAAIARMNYYESLTDLNEMDRKLNLDIEIYCIGNGHSRLTVYFAGELFLSILQCELRISVVFCSDFSHRAEKS